MQTFSKKPLKWINNKLLLFHLILKLTKAFKNYILELKQPKKDLDFLNTIHQIVQNLEL